MKTLDEERFKHVLYNDFLRLNNPINHVAAWNNLFEPDGKNVRDYGLPEPVVSKTDLEIE